MNPLIADVLEAKARQDVEIVSLEQTFEHEAKCQVNHHNTNPVCSVEVTHRLTTACGIEANWCNNTVKAWAKLDKRQVCVCLKTSVEKCWTIRPI